MKRIGRYQLMTLLALMSLNSCSINDWSKEERRIIENSDSIMRVLTIDNAEDSLILRKQCKDIPLSSLSDELYSILSSKMISTVTSPEQDGVGIAGPQIGILRRIVAVQRFDKTGEPFIVYPNIRITALKGDKIISKEGCLSIPNCRGEVLRYPEVEITYSLPADRHKAARDTIERVSGFSAIIFQHECDHLDGILYTDKLIP
ncbi:MAG: peptide deformylase [Candidatus Cryptobacteroides sp.]